MIRKGAFIVFLTGLLNIMLSQGFDISRSLYSDVKAHQIGDIITVLIVESANASRESNISSSTDSDISADASMDGNIFSAATENGFLPLFGASSSLSTNHDGQEGTKQKEQLTGKISATIVNKTDNGMLLIEGRRTLEVNGEENLMELSGMIRPRDIQTDNTVFSYNVADAEITYRKSGVANKFMKPGTTKRWTTTVLLLLALVVGMSGEWL